MKINKLGIGLLGCAFLSCVTMFGAALCHKPKVEPAKPGSVILLLGTSSAGKTTVINELKKISGDRYEFTSVDIFTDSYPPSTKIHEQLASSTLDQKAKMLLVEKYLDTLTNDFYSFAKDKAAHGAHIFVDTIPLTENAHKEYEQIAQILKDISHSTILLYCPLDALIAHVEERNRAGLPGEKRYTMQAFGQFQQLYKTQDSPSEEILDRVPSKKMKDLRRAAIKEFMNAAPPGTSQEEIDRVAQQQEDNYKEYVKLFKLDELMEVPIVAQVPFDLVISCKLSPAKLAQQIKDYLLGNNLPKITYKVQAPEDAFNDVIHFIKKLPELQAAGYAVSLPKNKCFEPFYKNPSLLTVTEEATLKKIFFEKVYDVSLLEPSLAIIAQTDGTLQKALKKLAILAANWGFQIKPTYDIVTTLYGPGGLYRMTDTTGTIVLKIDETGTPQSASSYTENIIHEMVHIGIEESIVKKYALSHSEKERLVDLICLLYLHDLLPDYVTEKQDKSIDPFITYDTITKNLPRAVEAFIENKAKGKEITGE